MSTYFYYEKLHDTYYYAIVIDYRIVVDIDSNYFNASKLCEDMGKNFSKWLKSERVQAFAEQFGTYRKVYFSRKTKIPPEVNGYYMPKEYLSDILAWISPEVYSLCNDYLLSCFAKESKVAAKYNYGEFMKCVDERMNDLKTKPRFSPRRSPKRSPQSSKQSPQSSKQAPKQSHQLQSSKQSQPQSPKQEQSQSSSSDQSSSDESDDDQQKNH